MPQRVDLLVLVPALRVLRVSFRPHFLLVTVCILLSRGPIDVYAS